VAEAKAAVSWFMLTTTTSPNSLSVRPSYAYDSIDEPFVKPPPCIHTITGFLNAGSASRR
jgi:hypothetical protein